MKMNKALYKKKGIAREIFAVNISRNQYYKEYRGYLFCPEDSCNAKLSFVQRKNNVKYFRTFPSTDHKDGCPNEVEYDDIKESYSTKTYEKRLNISDRHIKDVLERAYNRLLYKPSNGHNNGENKGKKYLKKDKSIGNAGIAELFEEGIDGEYGKEPYIITRMYNEINREDDNQIRCVIGYVHNIQLLQSHGYINLTPRMTNSVKVHFAEYFAVNNESEFNNMNIIKAYINLLKLKKKDIICCCIGRIKYVNTGINIILDRHQGFTLNGMTFYQIVAYMNNHKNEL